MRERLSAWEMTVGMILMLVFDKPKQTMWHSWLMSNILTIALSSCVDTVQFSCYNSGNHSLFSSVACQKREPPQNCAFSSVYAPLTAMNIFIFETS